MPVAENNAFPAAWSSQRTIKRMRRIGIIAPIDNTRIDRIATAFVGDTNDEKEELQVNNALALQLLEQNQRDAGASVQGDLTVATALRSGVEDSWIRTIDADHQDRALYVGDTYGRSDAQTPDLMHEVLGSRAAAKSQGDRGAHAMATSVEKPDLNGEAIVTNSLRKVTTPHGIIDVKDTDGVITSATTLRDIEDKGGAFKTENKVVTTMKVSGNPDVTGNGNKGPLIGCQVDNTVEDRDSLSVAEVDDIIVATDLPLSAGDMISPNGRDHHSYPYRITKKSEWHVEQNGKDQVMQASLINSAEKFSIGEMEKEQGNVVLRSTKTGIAIGSMTAVVDISALDENNDGAGHEEVGGEGPGSVCTPNSKRCKKCCTKSLSLAE